MHILIVAATMREIEPIIEQFRIQNVQNNLLSGKINRYKVDCLGTGMGMVATTYHLTKALDKKNYQLIINAGICGSFRDDLTKGAVVEVLSEQFADFGIDDNGTFRPVFEDKFIERDDFPFHDGLLVNPVKHHFTSHLVNCAAITVNTITGSAERIALMKQKFKPDIESMEGAAVFYVALSHQLPFVEIRSVSNMVEPRNSKNWNISLAIDKLNSTLIGIFDKI
jgi:futalosine hydrolase